MRRSLLFPAAIVVVVTAAVLVALTSGGTVAGPAESAAAAASSPRPALTRVEPDRIVHKVVGLGDSVPAGTACSCTSYVTLVAQRLAAVQHTHVAADSLAQPGLTTAALMAQLNTRYAAAELADADLVIVTIGANDLEAARSCSPATSRGCYATPLRALAVAYPQVLVRLRQLMTRTGARILVTGYWNVFLDGAVARQQGGAYVANSDALTRAVNQVIAEAAAKNTAIYVDLFAPFKGGDRDDTPLLAPDGDHPNAAGHRVIAVAISNFLTGAGTG